MDLKEKLNRVGNKPPSMVSAHAIATIAKQVLTHAENLRAITINQECSRELNDIIVELQKTPSLLEACNKSTDLEFNSLDSSKYISLSRHVYNCLDSLIWIKSEYYL